MDIEYTFEHDDSIVASIDNDKILEIYSSMTVVYLSKNDVITLAHAVGVTEEDLK
jgi:hypothetical protein